LVLLGQPSRFCFKHLHHFSRLEHKYESGNFD
jgi:hypothetical protein